MNWIRRPIGSSARLRSGREVFTRVFWSINMCIRGLCYHSTLSPPRKWLSYGFLMMLCISHKTAITNALFRLKLRLGNHLNLAITERVCQLLCGDYCKNISMSESKTSSFKRLKSLPVKSSHRKGLWLTVNKFFIVILSLHYCKWLTVLFCEIRISSCQLDIRFRNITSDWVLSQWDLKYYIYFAVSNLTLFYLKQLTNEEHHKQFAMKVTHICIIYIPLSIFHIKLILQNQEGHTGSDVFMSFVILINYAYMFLCFDCNVNSSGNNKQNICCIVCNVIKCGYYRNHHQMQLTVSFQPPIHS